MAIELSKIKKRINSVSSALKVTKAMKLVSSIKVQKWKKQMLSNRDYVNCLEDISNIVFTHAKKIDSSFLKENETDRRLFIVVTSSLGLCAAYNQNIFKYCDKLITKNDDLIIFGSKGLKYFKKNKYNCLDFETESKEKDDDKIIKELTNFIIDEFKKDKYKNVNLIYTHFKNSLSFIPTTFKILPFENISKNSKNEYPPLMEPSSKEIVDKLFPLYFKSTLYSKLLEAEVSEHASRSNAMDNATNNATELLEMLQLEFNKARQTSITEEIIEIVSGSQNK